MGSPAYDEQVMPNKRIELAPFGRPTRKQRGCLLAAHPRRYARKRRLALEA